MKYAASPSDAEVQILIKMINGGSTAAELGRYIASVKRVAADMGLLLEARGALHKDADVSAASRIALCLT